MLQIKKINKKFKHKQRMEKNLWNTNKDTTQRSIRIGNESIFGNRLYRSYYWSEMGDT